MSELGTYLLGMLLRGCLLALLLITVERLFQVRPGRKQLLVLLCLSFLPLSQPVLRLPPEIQLRTMQTVRRSARRHRLPRRGVHPPFPPRSPCIMRRPNCPVSDCGRTVSAAETIAPASPLDAPGTQPAADLRRTHGSPAEPGKESDRKHPPQDRSPRRRFAQCRAALLLRIPFRHPASRGAMRPSA